MTISPSKRKSTVRGRFYSTPDGEFPSVTNILGCIGKPAVIAWAAKEERNLVMDCSADLYQDCPAEKMSRMAWIATMEQRLGTQKAHERLLAKAAEIGTQCHNLIEWTLRAKLCQQPGPSPSISDKAMWAFSCYERWAKKVSLKPILVEQTVYSKTYGYAGTMDLLAEVEGKLTVIDFKTGKSVYPEAHLQANAYKYALREMGHGNAQQAIIVRLPKNETDPEPEPVLADEEDNCMEVFLAVKRMWHWLQMKDKYLAEKEKNESLQEMPQNTAA